MNIIYPENSAEIIQEIVKKYNFSESVDEVVKNILKEDSGEKREETISNLPNSKIAKMIVHLAEGSISQQALPKIIEEELKVSSKIAGEIAKILEEKIIPFVQIEKTAEDNKKVKSPPTQPSTAEAEIKIIKKPDAGDDTYREPIE